MATMNISNDGAHLQAAVPPGYSETIDKIRLEEYPMLKGSQ